MNIETAIRTAYAKIAARTDNPYVGLAALRAHLDPGIAREDVDRALDQMIERPDVHLTAELNQRLLTDADHAAAVDIADEPRHVLYVEPTAPVETERTPHGDEQLGGWCPICDCRIAGPGDHHGPNNCKCQY
jgi:hypothetical protein